VVAWAPAVFAGPGPRAAAARAVAPPAGGGGVADGARPWPSREPASSCFCFLMMQRPPWRFAREPGLLWPRMQAGRHASRQAGKQAKRRLVLLPGRVTRGASFMGRIKEGVPVLPVLLVLVLMHLPASPARPHAAAAKAAPGSAHHLHRYEATPRTCGVRTAP